MGVVNPNKVRIGSLPTRDLGLPDEVMVDGFGHRLVYAVTEAYTIPGAPMNLSGGSIALQDSSLNNATNGNVVYLLMAPGEDPRGAYNLAGQQPVSCGSASSNLAYNNCSGKSNTFVEAPKSLGTAQFTSAIAFLAGETVTNGACGSASSSTPVAFAPTTNLCASGTPTGVTGTNPWSWSCAGQNGGVTATTCSAISMFTSINGVCGAANGVAVSTAPTTGLCTTGTSTAVTGTGPWSWTCAGSGGGTTASCAAPVPAVVNGTCGIAIGTYSTAPTTLLCNTGTASAVAGPGPTAPYPTIWTWTCNGSGGGTTSTCTATPAPPPLNGACGAANGTAVASAPTTGLCSAGTSTAVAGTGPWSWSCTGLYGGTTASCSAPVAVPVVNGACGAANGVAVASAPTTLLCTTGTSTAVAGTGPWTWSCNGSGGGTNATSCNAPLAVGPSYGTGHVYWLPFPGGDWEPAAGNGGLPAIPADDGGYPTLADLQPVALGMITAANLIPKSQFYTAALWSDIGQAFLSTLPTYREPSSLIPGTPPLNQYEYTPSTYAYPTTAQLTTEYAYETLPSTTPWATLGTVPPTFKPGYTGYGFLPLQANDAFNGGPAFNTGTQYMAPVGRYGICVQGTWNAPTTNTYTFESMMGPWFPYFQSLTIDGDPAKTVTEGPFNADGPVTGTWDTAIALTAGPHNIRYIAADVEACFSGAGGCTVGNISVYTPRLVPVPLAPPQATPSTLTPAQVALWECPGAPVTSVTGACGAANGVIVSTAPTTGLCTTGLASAVGGTGPWSWTCNGSGGGTTASCAAPVTVVNGSCGGTNGTAVSSAPTGGLCTFGSASAVAGTGPWTWTCNGAGGGTNASCSASVAVVNGTCGATNGTTVSTAPTTGLCTTGSATAVAGTGPWAWSCNGSGGGTNQSCSALVAVVNGACGSANGSLVSPAPSGATLCSAGTATPSTATQSGSNWTWACNGVGGGTNASCSASVLACGANPFNGDLEILIDGSGSVLSDFTAEKNFVKDLVSKLNLTATSHIGLIEFGSKINGTLSFNIAGLVNVNPPLNQAEVRRDLSDYNWIKAALTNALNPNHAQLMINTTANPFPSPVKDAVIYQSPAYTSATLSSFNTMLGTLTNANSLTDIYGGLLAATDQARNMSANTNKVILLITDGAETVQAMNPVTDITDDRLHYAAVARAAEALGIRVIVVGVQDASYNPWELRDATINQKNINLFEATSATTLMNTEAALTGAMCTPPASMASLYKKISAGGGTSGGRACAITYDGVAKCWGDNTSGALGNGNNISYSTPQLVARNTGVGGSVPMAAGTFWTDISVGGGYNGGSACGLMSDGSAWCWGNNYMNQLGCHEALTTNHPKYCTSASPDAFNIPQRVSTPYASNASSLALTALETDTSWADISAGSGGYGFGCGRTMDGHAWCWGGNAEGQLGDGTVTGRAYPVLVTSLDSAFNDIDSDLYPWNDIQGGGGLSYASTCGVRNFGEGRCWGFLNGTGAVKSPAVISGVQFQTINTGSGIDYCGLGRSGSPNAGQLYCWGDNLYGQVGVGSGTNAFSLPQLVASPTGAPWTAISNSNAGVYTVCGLTADSKAWCWGLNSYGQFGNNTWSGASALSPKPAADIDLSGNPLTISWQDISSGGGPDGFTCGLASDNTAWCWGSDGVGQIGDGIALPTSTTVTVLSPFHVP